MKNAVVLGKGLLGREFELAGFEVWDRNKFQVSETMSPHEIVSNLLKTEVDIIINCIGKSNTRWCEDRKNFKQALFVNGTLPGYLSDFCKSKGKKFVHISTGCLYDEIGRPCLETDYLATHCAYTVTKYVGEKGCDLDRDIIIRPRLLYSGLKCEYRNNLLMKLPKFSSYLDSFNSITSCRTIVEATKALLEHNQSGAFNCADSDVLTMFEIAKVIGLTEGKTKMSPEELVRSQKLHLVNNVMSIDKLKEFYTPPKTSDELLRCWKELNN
jgi:dTDP-4-dehydrorhamnose reductase